ncbi:SDR family NAD(P)-dependent oxidoreductase [Vulcanococcus limneticus Candia 3F8]|uniref:type I polyketide synthase n=1 Tax=Vulcanococcus limneticus TaxID=2170428 RepID=UPI0018E3EBEB|nr:type I polyketide synthase [Vulcanococcus limneticus]MCP9793026.1 SDR family NAD(P)-dependent oxidoreductase [Vulcanococcus limneticus MW73D5]MCP9895017.1 SDR family NAD(P)-dependent oxidoreductase [Vulcanococcus limneticus Candia 3F8]MCP9898424.1 SDR family NAD(P)-dependent oxidoreductase [Vulcanococcus limneticus Candia 3B3]
MASPEPIAIIGVGCRLPGGVKDAESFWDLLREGRDAITEVPPERWDLTKHFDPDPQAPLRLHVSQGGFIDGIDQFDPSFFGITPREAVCMDPQQRLLMEVAWQTLEDAGQPLDGIRGQQVGVFMGISSSDYSSLLWISEEDFAIPDNEPFVLPGNTGCIAANRLSYFFDFKGPSFTVDTACSSSLVAVHLACESLWRGECSAALAGGVQALIQPAIQGIFCKAGLLAPDGRCKSFDAAANGYVRSEGAGAVMLKPLSRAEADGDAVYALIHGSAMNSDGRSNGMVAPNLRAQVACVRAAFARAGIAPAATQYVEAHGTGTRQGDPIELRALGTVLGEGREESRPCRVGSVKTNLGHSETAAGITGLIKATLCVQHRQLPPSLHFRTPNPSIDFQGLKLQVQTRLEPFPEVEAPAVVGVSSFGFGGTNAHVVLGEPPRPAPKPRYGRQLPLQLLTLSARTPVALQAQARQLAEHLQTHPHLDLADVCATANQCRSQLVQRLTCLAGDRSTLISQLQDTAEILDAAKASEIADAQLPTGVAMAQASRNPGRLAFLFTGQGSQSLGMAQELHEQHPVFRNAFERCTAVLDPLLEQPLATVLFPADRDAAEATQRLNQTGLTQPALFVVGYALSQLWLSWGIEPDLLLGHSVGEVVAAHLAGVFSLEDALLLIAARGRLMQALPSDGGMLALPASQQDVEKLVAQLPGGDALSFAALNGPANTVVSGPRPLMEALEKIAAGTGLRTTRLAVSHAFHSPAMAPMLAEFEQQLSRIRFKPPTRLLVSNLTGQLAGPEIAQPDYWCEHILNPVRFANGIATAAAQGITTFLELGARPTLIGMGRQCLPDPQFSWWPSLRSGMSDWQVLLTSLAGLHRQGYPIDWKGFHLPFPHRRIRLPGYPFQRQRYWWGRRGDAGSSVWLDHIKGPQAGAGPERSPTSNPTTNWCPAGELIAVPLPGGEERRYRTWLSAEAPADLADHCIRSQVVFPAAGFITLALQALAQADRPLILQDLELERPLRLGDHEKGAYELQLVVGEHSIEFHSQPLNVQPSITQGQNPAGPAEPWQRHGQASLPGSPSDANIVSHGPTDGPIITVERPEGAQTVPLRPFYAALSSYGLDYGPGFQGLEELWRHEQKAWVRLQRPRGAGDWALLDACFQAVAATLDPTAAAGQLFLPVGLEALWLARVPLPDRLHCQVELASCEEPAFVQAHLLLTTTEGDGQETIGWIRGFRLRRLPRQALDWLFPLHTARQHRNPGVPAYQPWLVRTQWQACTDGVPGVISVAQQPLEHPPADVELIWPDPKVASLNSELANLLTLSQQGNKTIWLALEGDGELQGALAGFARTAALEQPKRQWFTLHLPPEAKAGGLAIPWSQITDLAASEPMLAFDGRQLWRRRIQPLPPARFRIVTQEFGLLESLQAQPWPSEKPAPGEVEVNVEATGLNFRDVLNALGLLRSYSRELGLDDAAQVPFGGECVGTVSAVGEGVDPMLLGQRVLAALAVGSLASHVLCRAELCIPLPEEITPEVGASLSTAFLTALYGLETLADLQPGETVLIHAAAGGVGQAAVQVALRKGARVYATASREKKALLLEQGCAEVFNSRSLSFAEKIRNATGGQGVDVVLNSLKGEWVDASFATLAEGGRFVELGKIDIWTREQAQQRRPDARYLPFDLLEVAAAQPQLVRDLLVTIMEDFRTGAYQPLPLQVLSIEQSVDAFRLMAQARHVGKVVIRQPDRMTKTIDIGSLAIREDATYLVTGAFGGIGLQLLPWLADQGARSLLLISRSADTPSPEAEEILTALTARGVRYTRLAINLATQDPQADQASSPLVKALMALPIERPLRGIFHAAGIIDDAALPEQTPERLEHTIAPKLKGWQNLKAALQASDQDPELVVQFSSMASLLGSPGQAAYTAANAALDSAMEIEARPGWMSLQWGPWQGAGMAGTLEQWQRDRLQLLGIELLKPDLALQALGDLIQRGAYGSIGILDVDWQRLSQQLGHRNGAPLEVIRAAQATAAQSESEDPSGQPVFVGILANLPGAERPLALQAMVQQQLAKVMGISEPSQIDPCEPLFNLGLDSLMALELMVLIEKNLGITLTESLVFEHPTIEDLCKHFLAELFAEPFTNQGPATQNPEPKVMPEATGQPENDGEDTIEWGNKVDEVRNLDPASIYNELILSRDSSQP